MLKIKVRKRTVLIFLTLIGLLAYFNSFSVPFHYDDISLLREKTAIKSFHLFSNWLKEDYSRIITGRTFLLFTFYLNYIVNELDTFGYHLVNLLIHISTAFLFYLLLAKYVYPQSLLNSPRSPLRLRGDGGVIKEVTKGNVGGFYHLKAILPSTLFLLHPINTESVTYISSRSSELSALFILSSMLMFFKATRNKFSFSYYLFSVFFFILGLSTKEAAIVTPMLIVLFDFYFVSDKNKNFKARIKYHLPFWGIILFGSIYYLGYITHPAMHGRPWLTHSLTELKVFVEYLKLLILPFGLNIDHYINESFTLDLGVIFSITIVIGLLLVSVFFRNKNRIVSFSILWFFLNLAPFLTIRLQDYMAERWVYTASIGFALFVSELLIILFGKYKKTWVFAVVCLPIFFGILTHMRNNVYKDPITLWSDAVKKSPEKIRPYTNLCAYHVERREMDRAIEVCETAINKGSNQVETYINLATAYFFKNDLNNAEKILLSMADNKTIMANVNNTAMEVYYYNLGSIYKGKKEYNKAIEEYKNVLKITPRSPSALGLIAECYSLLGMKDNASEYFHLTTEGIPQNGDDYVMLAKSFFHLGENQRGVDNLNKAVIADPLNVNIRHAVATIFLEGGNEEAAYRHFSKIAKISPNFAPAYTGMGKAMLSKGNLKEARKHFNKALSLLSPDSPERKELLELLTKTQG